MRKEARVQIAQITTTSPEETAALGKRFGAQFSKATFALVGDLGAGKTLLSRSICIGAGVDPDSISSPTFTLINEYHGRVVVNHMDTYRLDPESFIELGIDEILAGEGIKLIEWADRIEEHLLSDTLYIDIEHTGEYERTFTFSSECSQWASQLKPLLG